MILIGQYDSPFVRRVAVSLRLLGLDYEHRPWSVFTDAAKVGAYNPLCRVPVLVLDDGEVLIESGAILDHLDEGAGTRRLLPAAGPARRRQLQIAALATGLAEKAVALVYERALHEETSAGWIARCEGQVGAVLARLEAEVAALAGPFFAGAGPGQADIALGCALRFVREAHPELFDAGRWPALAAFGGRCEALPAFAAVVQVFIPPN